MPSTARASSCPSTARSTPAAGIGIIITPGRRRLPRAGPSSPRPRAWRRITCSRLTPAPKRSAREHSPPIERAASSSTLTPLAVHAQLGVDRSLPQAQRARRPRSDRLDLGQDGRRQPRRRHVQRLLEVRPLERVGLVEDRQHLADARRAAAPRPPPPRRAGSSPAAAARRPARRRRRESPRTRSAAARACSASSARITPRLPDNPSGLTTQGKPTSRATAATSAPQGSSAKRGCGTPASASARRIAALSRVRATAAGGLCGKPEALGAQRGGHHTLIVDAHDRGERGLPAHARRSARPPLPGPTGAG